jgi:hypothetical protein
MQKVDLKADNWVEQMVEWKAYRLVESLADSMADKKAVQTVE